MNILLVEDEPLVKEEILGKLRQLGYTKLFSTDNVKDAKQILGNEDIQAAIVDIELIGPDDGIILGEYLNGKVPFIYLSDLQDLRTFERAKQTNPSTNIPKPVGLLQLRNSLLEIESNVQKSLEKTIVISVNGKKHTINRSEIIYLKAARSNCEVVLNDKRYISATPMNNVLSNLGENFLQVHRSYSVNLDFVSKYQGNMIFTIPKFAEIPLGDLYRNDFLGRFEVL